MKVNIGCNIHRSYSISSFSFFLSMFVHAVKQNVKLATHQIVTGNVRDIMYRSGTVDS